MVGFHWNLCLLDSNSMIAHFEVCWIFVIISILLIRYCFESNVTLDFSILVHKLDPFWSIFVRHFFQQHMIFNSRLNHSLLGSFSAIILKSASLNLERRFSFFKIYGRRKERFCEENKTTYGKHAEITN